MRATLLRRLDDFAGWLLFETAQAALRVLLAVGLIIVITYQALSLGFRYPLDYGESPLADQAVRLAAGDNIYRPDLSSPPYTISNYPPLYMAVLAPFAALLGPGFAVGRLVSIVGAWVAAACLAAMVYASSRDRLAAMVSAAVFLGLPYVMHWSGFMRVDLLALSLSLAALALLARWPAERWSLWTAGLLLVAAIYTRQSYALAAPLAAFIWLLTRSRHGWRRALALAALAGGLTLALFLVLQFATGGGFYFNIVTANVNAYEPDILHDNVERLVGLAWPLLLLGAASLVLLWRWNPLYALAAPYLLGSALSALTIGKVGSNVNYLLELCAALSLAAGIVLVWLRQHVRSFALTGALLALLATQSLLSMRVALDDYAIALSERLFQGSELRQLETLVRAAERPVLADEYMGLSTLTGHRLYLQPFETTQLAVAGVWDQSPLLASIAAQAFDLILIYDVPWYVTRWTPEMLATIEDNYRLTARLANVRVYKPYEASEAEIATACPGAPWQLPSSADRGMQGEATGLLFFGAGVEGSVPVYAVADGVLYRPPGWVDAVAIEHDDPLHPGQTVWTYYADLVSADGRDAHIAPEFPPNSWRVPVRAGQVIGYQGAWGGRPNWPRWIHARFAVLRLAPGTFPETVTAEMMVDPAPYLGLPPALTAVSSRVRPFACATPP